MQRCTKVATALLDGGAIIDFVTPPRRLINLLGFTPLMYAAIKSRAGVVKMLLERGADGTKIPASQTISGVVVAPPGTALDIVRSLAHCGIDFAETFAVLRMLCCSGCGVTSTSLSAAAAAAGAERYLKSCAGCPPNGSRAHYCGKECQRADWVLRHRGECAEARRAAGNQV